ncbi:acyl-CoA synthetase (AMP-forming)/AMP-acid ligase II [Georgenia soli]|uniref:Acyl-CoA synthetase (AMP-forming)/AMP-acid ligase II n=1 Tax=Georgenia soli TaxID=638953 RepID=A0A2A9ESJ6_9MICO|nr:alpha/beta fold hydrolase [Georgenia soli]PFG41215.1 acyl-CoA synthetase (AMP-forming)/AMP-acid ligase II [Georgenia soli]
MSWPGVDPSWSRRAVVAGHAWHYLDNTSSLPAGRAPHGTVLCVHGNPTWSYLWRSVLAAGAEAGWRVVAVDQLEMGFSEHTGAHHRLADRVAQLGALTDHLGLSGPGWDGLAVVTLGHDWGGVVSMGWAVDHPRELAGLILTNTAVHQPGEKRVPALLRLARHRSVHAGATTVTPAFLDVTLSLASPALAPEVREAYRSPYRTADDRRGIGTFVEDIPVDAGHPSHAELARIAGGVAALDVPALLMWGPKDPVFYERYLRDLRDRLPHADIHRFEGAGHLVVEDADVAGTVVTWLRRRLEGRPAAPDQVAAELPAPVAGQYRPLYAALDELSGSETPAVVALSPGGTSELTWADLARRVEHLALGLVDSGVRPGHRVSLLIPPGVDLTTALFACLRIGAVVVLADAGLGVRGLTRAVRGAYPDHILGIERAMVAARALGWPGQKFVVVPRGHEAGYTPPRTAHSRRRTIGIAGSLRELLARGATLAAAGTALPAEPAPEDDAAILFTSGSTGPAKGVVYTHRGLAGMCSVVAATLGISPERPFVAGFAPFALIGTAVGATSATPDMDVTAPGTLRAGALADAVAAIDAYAVFASPSALANVVRTARDLTPEQRDALAGVQLFLSAGAPISSTRLAQVLEVMPNAEPHTPYGMTEVLPLTDVSLDQIRAAEADAATGAVAGAGNGSCVGTPVPDAQIRIVPLDATGAATGEPTATPGVTGEVLVTAPNLKDRYDQLWATQDRSATWPGWHRTGDVGHLDASGRLWIEGRLAHVIVTADGVVTPVQVENDAMSVRGVVRAAAVGVGPVGTQQVAVVVETDPALHAGARRAPSLAPEGLARAVRSAVAVPVAAVLRVPEVPTDVRHNSKVERARIADWAARMLAGARAGRP